MTAASSQPKRANDYFFYYSDSWLFTRNNNKAFSSICFHTHDFFFPLLVFRLPKTALALSEEPPARSSETCCPQAYRSGLPRTGHSFLSSDQGQVILTFAGAQTRQVITSPPLGLRFSSSSPCPRATHWARFRQEQPASDRRELQSCPRNAFRNHTCGPQYILPKCRGAVVREGFFYPTETNCLLSLKPITCRDLCRDNGLPCNFYCQLKATTGSLSNRTKATIAFPIISYFVCIFLYLFVFCLYFLFVFLFYLCRLEKEGLTSWLGLLLFQQKVISAMYS